MYLIIRHKQDQYGLTAPPTHKHIADYKKARYEFSRLTKTGTYCELMMDSEYEELYAIKGGKAQGESAGRNT